MDFIKAKENLIKNQLIPCGLKQPMIIEAYETLSRQNFVLEGYQDFAFSDIGAPFATGSHLLNPRDEALLIQKLKPQKSEKALVIGAGGLFVAAIFSYLGLETHVVEQDAALSARMMQLYAKEKIKGVVVSCQNPQVSLPKPEFDIIFSAFSQTEIPDLWFDSLNEGGRMVAIVEDGTLQQAMFCMKHQEEWQEKILFELKCDQEVKNQAHFVF